MAISLLAAKIAEILLGVVAVTSNDCFICCISALLCCDIYATQCIVTMHTFLAQWNFRLCSLSRPVVQILLSLNALKETAALSMQEV